MISLSVNINKTFQMSKATPKIEKFKVSNI